MKQITGHCAAATRCFFLRVREALRAQAPEGPMAPRPGQPVQHAPPNAQAKLKVQVALVNMPVTVRNAKGDMVNDLDAKDFRITDNGIEQKISHFDLGGDPLSLVILIETSSRIDPLLPGMRKTGILFTQTVMGPEGEAAVVGFNDAVDKLQDFTSDGDAIENVMAHLQTGTSGSKLYDAMAVGVDMLSSRMPQPTAERPGRRRVMLVMSETVDVGQRSEAGRSAAEGAARERDDLQRRAFDDAFGIERQTERQPTDADRATGHYDAAGTAGNGADSGGPRHRQRQWRRFAGAGDLGRGTRG